MPSLEHTLEVLRRTPSVIRHLVLGLSDEWTCRNYGEKTWSAYEVVSHLSLAEKINWMPRLKHLLEHGDTRPFDAFPQDSAVSPTSGIPLGVIVGEFEVRRVSNLRELKEMGLTDDDLKRPGLHPALGPVTAGQLLCTWAVHDLHHLRQIELAMAWQYRDAVGPWRKFLNTLHREPAGS